MYVLPLLEESLVPDLVSEICEKWVHQDLFACFTPTFSAAQWYRYFKALILRAHQGRAEIQHLVSLSQHSQINVKWLRQILLYAIENNHLLSIHLLLDAHPVLTKSPYAEAIFVRALKSNRPHLLRLFVVLWHFDLSIPFLEKCHLWTQKTPSRSESFAFCAKECEILIPSSS